MILLLYSGFSKICARGQLPSENV